MVKSWVDRKLYEPFGGAFLWIKKAFSRLTFGFFRHESRACMDSKNQKWLVLHG